MSFILRSLIITATITCCAQQIAEGQIVRRALSHIFCHKCSRYNCGCPQPLTVAPQTAACVPPATQCVGGPIAQSCTKTCTTVHPVTETRYRRENFMTCRTECRTAYRQEAYCETVPKTCVENVTRDEGCYQMVWVPKPVTRQVCKTVYQNRTAYRSVPYQYNVQVPQMNTRVVPVQSVRYVRRTQTFCEPMQPVCAAPLPAPITPGCAVPANVLSGALPTPLTSQASAHQGSPWSKVAQRASAERQAKGANYLRVSAARQPAAGTPSAAAVWQTRR